MLRARGEIDKKVEKASNLTINQEANKAAVPLIEQNID
jgi:hypothetical protein